MQVLSPGHLSPQQATQKPCPDIEMPLAGVRHRGMHSRCNRSTAGGQYIRFISASSKIAAQALQVIQAAGTTQKDWDHSPEGVVAKNSPTLTECSLNLLPCPAATSACFILLSLLCHAIKDTHRCRRHRHCIPWLS